MTKITNNIYEAKSVLENNGIIAIPTETVYGIAGNIYNESAIMKIFSLKKVAVRVPNHKVCLALLNELSFPLAAPSANPFGQISPTTSAHVFNYFQENLSIILEGGECYNGIESTIIGFESNDAILYRHGAITIEEIEKIIGKLKINIDNNENPQAPGMLTKHYSTKTKLYLVDNPIEFSNQFKNKKIGMLLFDEKYKIEHNKNQIILSKNRNLKEATQKLYSSLHFLDKQNLDIIIAEKMPQSGLGKSINDRLERATK